MLMLAPAPAAVAGAAVVRTENIFTVWRPFRIIRISSRWPYRLILLSVPVRLPGGNRHGIAL